MKTIFSKKQAIAVILQCEKKVTEIDIFAVVDEKHKYFSLSCEEIEKKLLNYVQQESLAGVLEQVH